MKFKNLFKSDFETYHRASPCRPTVRFVTAVIDFFILTVVSLCLYFGTFAVTTSLDGYIESGNRVTEEVEYYNDYIKETHLVEFYVTEEGEEMRCETEEVAIKILLRSLKFSYSHDKNNDFNPDYDVNEKLKQYEETNFTNDNIYYFLSEYLPAHNQNNEILDLKGQSVTEFYQYCIKKSTNDAFFVENFSVDETTGITYIKPYIANRIMGFLFYEVDNAADQTYYNDSLQTYIRILTDLENIMLANPDYQTNHYLPYQEAFLTQVRYIVVSFIINLAISYLLTIVLPQILFKDGRTIGRRIFNVGLVDKNHMPVKWYIHLVRNILGFMGESLSILLIPLLPIFNFRFNSITSPLFFVGNLGVTLGLILIIVAIVVGFNAVLVPILKKRTTIIDLITQVRVVDGHYLDEIEYEEPRYEGE